jgi:hypothetical protein
MGITPDLSGQTRRQPGIALAQRQARLLGERHQAPARLLVEPCVGRMRDRLLHDRRVHDHRLRASLGDHPGRTPGLDRLGQEPFDTFLSDPVPPPRQRRGIDRRTVLEERLATEVLVVRVLHPPGHDRLIRQLVGVLEVKQPRHQPRRGRRAPRMRREEPRPLLLEELPVDQRGQLHQLVAQVDHVRQTRSQQVVLLRGAGFGLHVSIRNCRVLARNLPNPAVGHDSGNFNVTARRVKIRARELEIAHHTSK